MQCPACSKEFSPESFGDPAKCPACGVYYVKALALRHRQEQQARLAAQEPSGGKLASALRGAKGAVEEGRRRREHQDLAQKASRAAVVVTDVQIPFMSMVVLLVKMVLAAIPAAIIVSLIGAVIYGAFQAVQDAYKSSPAPVPAPSSTSAQTFRVPSDSGAHYQVIDYEHAGTNVVITTQRTGADGNRSYAKRFIDCRAARWRYLGAGDTVSEMEANEASGTPAAWASFDPGSIAHEVAKKACEGIPGTHTLLK